MIVYLGVVYEYNDIFIIVFDDNLVINIKFSVQYCIIYNV
jgi:hypothetical protein